MGAVAERSPAQTALAAEIGARMAEDGGAALLVDYGRAEAGFGDTLQALSRHARVDPLASAGAADLTVHVDFPAVAEAARAQGAAVSPIASQRAFLRRLGVEARAAALVRSRPDQAEVIARQLHRLIAPDQMGELFKVVSIHTQGLDPPGFTPQEGSDMTHARHCASRRHLAPAGAPARACATPSSPARAACRTASTPASMSVGARDDDPAAVAQNRARAAAHFGQPVERLLACYQVHSAKAVIAEAPWGDARHEVDGVATATPGLVCGALSADCAPILFADAGARVVA